MFTDKVTHRQTHRHTHTQTKVITIPHHKICEGVKIILEKKVLFRSLTYLNTMEFFVSERRKYAKMNYDLDTKAYIIITPPHKM